MSDLERVPEDDREAVEQILNLGKKINIGQLSMTVRKTAIIAAMGHEISRIWYRYNIEDEMVMTILWLTAPNLVLDFDQGSPVYHDEHPQSESAGSEEVS